MGNHFIGQHSWPTHVVMPALAQSMAEWSMGLLVAAAILWGLRNMLTRRDPALVICMLAGAAASVLEVHTMEVFRFFYPQVGQHIALVGFGRPIPVFLVFMYSAFFGLSSYLLLVSRFARSFSARGFAIGMAALFVAELLLEVVSIKSGLWAYFDDQPFLFMEFPVHVAVIVGCMSVMLGAASRIWFNRVSGLRQWWMLIVGPVILTASYDAFTYPFAFAVASGGGLPAARLGSILSMALALGLTYVCAKTMARVPDLGSEVALQSKRSSSSRAAPAY